MHSLKKEPSWKEEGPTQNIKDCILEVQNKSEVIIVSEVSYFNNALISKDCIDRVDSINAKTSAETEAFIELRDYTPEQKNDVDSHILAHGRFSRNQEILMSEQGFIQIPRSLRSDPRWKGMRLKHKQVFEILLERCCWKKTKFNVRGNIIELEKGQICVSYRQLADWCNEEVSFKADRLDKNIVERAVSVFLKFQFARQETRHGKMVLTITIPGFYEEKENITETQTETKPRLNRDIKEEYKEYIERERSPLSPKKIREVGNEPEEKKQKPAKELADTFLESIKKFKPNFTKSVSPKWIKEFEKILKHRSMEEIVKIIELTHEDSFWKTVVLSPESLWRNLDQIESRINEKKEKTWTTKKKSNKCNQNSSDNSTPELILVPLSSRMNTEKKSWSGSGE